MIFQTNCIGIDIASDRVRVAVAVLKAGCVSILNLIEEEIPEAPSHEKKAVTASIIKKIYEENALADDLCVACLPVSKSINRAVNMPLTDPAKIRQTLKFRIEPQIPYPAEQVISDGITIRKLQENTEMLAIAVAKEPISERLKILEMAGVAPQILTLDALALADFYINPLDFSSEKITALLLIGPENSFLGFFLGNTLMGYRNLDGFIAGDEKAVDAFVRELNRSIVGFQSLPGDNAEVSTLCIGGNGAESLREVLQDSFRDFPVKTVGFNQESLAEIPPSLLNMADEYSLAIALAATGLRTSANPINLRQEEFVPPSLFSQFKPRIIFSLIILAVMMLAWFGNMRAQIYRQSKELEALNEEMMKIFADKLPGIKSPSLAKSRIKEERQKFNSLRNYSSEYVSPLEVLAEIAKSVPEGKNLILSEMHISDNTMRLRGTVDSFDDTDTFKNRIESSSLLSDAEIESTTKEEKGKQVKFRIRAGVAREPDPNVPTQNGDNS